MKRYFGEVFYFFMSLLLKINTRFSSNSVENVSESCNDEVMSTEKYVI